MLFCRRSQSLSGRDKCLHGCHAKKQCSLLDFRSGNRAFVSRHCLAAFFVLVVVLFSSVSSGTEPASDQEPVPEKSAAKPARKNVKLPGLVINFQKRCVDIEATTCLDEGMLELIACTKGSKEHESIVAVDARPMHIHTALLLLGANNGNPAMSRAVHDQGTRWVHLPPRGDPVDVYLVFEDEDGQMVERAISDFVARSDKGSGVFAVDEGTGREGDADEDIEFPKTFLFAGSHLRDNGPGPRNYLADESGNVISIATFGDELLCLPGMHAKANDALMWQVEAGRLPRVGSKVTLRLRPRNKSPAKTDEAERQQPKSGSQ